MSNPAVIVLAETRTDRGESFRIEDNIGEAIHLHYGEMRADFTIKEFLSFSTMIKESLSSLIEIEGFRLEQLDPIFLAALGDGLCDLESVAIEKISLSHLEVYSDSWFGVRLRPLAESRMYLALRGQSKDYLSYKQENFHGQTNMDRLSENLERVCKKGYPYKEQYIVLFNNQNIIRDGQHRAAALFYLNGDHEVPILRMRFRCNRFQLSRYPWVRALPGRLFRWPKQWFYGGYRRCRRFMGKELRRLGLR